MAMEEAAGSGAGATTSGQADSEDGGGAPRWQRRHSFAAQMQQPEWMTDVPADLGASW